MTSNRNLRHPNIVLFYGMCHLGSGEIGIVSEFVPHGNLRNVLQHELVSLEEKIFMYKYFCLFLITHSSCRETSKGMAYLGSKGVIHRDLACRNILVVSLRELSNLFSEQRRKMEYQDY